MPRWFVDLSLRAKFVTVTMLVGTVATVVATISFLLYANAATRSNMVRELTALTQIIADNTSAALVFNDPTAANVTLAALRVKKEITGVRILRPDGEVFVRYGTMPPPPENLLPANGGARFGEDHLWMTQPIVLDGETIGRIELTASLDVLRNDRNALIAIASAITLISTIVAFALSSTLQRVVIGPITHLAEVMRHVSTERAYDQRARRETNDELGELITGFNHMLEQIEAQHGELQGYRAQLEEAVRERTAQLQDANIQLLRSVTELRESKAALETANSTKSTFLANMSHELRTPLNAIIGFSEIMLKQLFGPLGNSRYQGYTEDIVRSAGHLLDIINDILDMTRVETGKMELHEEAVEVDDLIDDALRIVSPLMQAKSLRLVRPQHAHPFPRLVCDPVRTRQVLINLLSNSTKFTAPEGTLTIVVDVDDGMTIEISDTGVGIAESDIERVLTPFAQIENAYSRHHQGTGLGLPLSKALMELHQGMLILTSRLGHGTAVTLHFPPFRVLRSDSDRSAASD